MQEISGIELTLSEVITRNDDLQLANKVNIYNNKLDNLCTERNWGFNTHKSITRTHLNSYGTLKPKRNNFTGKKYKTVFKKSILKLKSSSGQEY